MKSDKKTKKLHAELTDEFDKGNPTPLPVPTVPTTNHLFDESKKKSLGLFKDEFEGKPIKMFVGLRAKMYALIGDGENAETKSVAKGIVRTVRKGLDIVDFKKALSGTPNKGSMVDYYSIRGQDHVLSTIKISKVGLSRFDDKTYLSWREESHRYGHHRIAGGGKQRMEDQALGENKVFVDNFLGGETIDEALDKEADPTPN